MADDLSFMEGYVPPSQKGKGAQPTTAPDETDFMSGYLPPGASATPAPTVGVGEDVARSVLAKGARGAIAIPGMLGDIPEIFGAKTNRPPTTEEYVQKLSSYSPVIEKALSYPPQTTPGRYAGAVAEFLPSVVIPGGGGLATKAIGAAGSGLGMQAVEDLIQKGKIPIQGTPYEAAGKLAGALAGGAGATRLASGVASGVRGLISPESEALSRAAGAYGTDIVRAGDKGARAGVAEAIESGLPVGAAGGQTTQRLVEQAAKSAGPEAAGGYNVAAQKFRDDAMDAVHGKIDDIFGRPVDAFEEMRDISQRIRQTNDANYTRVMSSPEAAAVTHPDLGAVFSRVDPQAMNSVLTSLRRNGVAPESLGLVKNPQGIYEIPATGASLKFWDELKQALDQQINSHYSDVTKQVRPGMEGEVRDLMGLKGALVGALDKAVPEYGTIRFEGSQLYGARNAVEAGRKFFADADPKRIDMAKQNVMKLNGPHKEDFAYGFAAAYKDALAKDAMSALGVYQGRRANFNEDKLRFALGTDKADELIGAANAAYLNSTMKQIPALSQSSGLKKAAGAGALAGIAGEVGLVGENMLQALSYSMAPTAIIGAITGAAGRALYNWKEQRVGEQLLKIMADPSRMQEVGELISKSPEARSFLAKTYTAIGKTAPVTESTARPERASGGRIVSESKADALVKAAESAKKQINQGTEALLDQPDETITRALAVAKKHI